MAAAAMQSTAAAATAAAATTTVAAAAAAGAAATVTVADRGARQQRHHWGVSRPLATFALLQAKGSRVVRLPRCVRVFWLNKKKKKHPTCTGGWHVVNSGGAAASTGRRRCVRQSGPTGWRRPPSPRLSSCPSSVPRPLARTKLASVSLNVPRPAAHSAQRGRVRPALGRDQRAAAAVAKGTRGAAAPRPQAGGRSVVCRHCRRRRCRRRQLTPSPLNVPFSPPQGPATSGKTVPSRPWSFGRSRLRPRPTRSSHYIAGRSHSCKLRSECRVIQVRTWRENQRTPWACAAATPSIGPTPPTPRGNSRGWG